MTVHRFPIAALAFALAVPLVAAEQPARANGREEGDCATAGQTSPSPTTDREDRAAGPAGRTPRFESAIDVESEPEAAPSSGIATRMAVPVMDVPLSVSVVPRRLLDEQAAFVLGDALENASGVNVATGFGVFDYFVIRGFDSLSSGLVLTDGVPEPESTYYPVYNVRQVEVLKGPASVLHGGNPLSGAILLARKQPLPRRFADMSLAVGGLGTFEVALDGNVASTRGDLAARLNATWQGSDGHRDLPSGSIRALNPTLSWRPDERTRLGLDLEYVESRWPPDTGIPFVGEAGDSLAPVPRDRSYQSPFDASRQEVARLRLEAERRFGDSLAVRNRFYFTGLDWESTGTLVLGAFPGPEERLQVPRSLVLLDDRQQFLGNQLEMLAAFRTGSLAHELLAGVELRRSTDRFTQDVGLLPAIDLIEPQETAVEPIVTIPQLGQSGDARALVLAPYVVDRVRVVPRVQAYLGARLDVLDYEDPETATARADTMWNPLLGAVYSPVETLALHASWGTASAAPSTQIVGLREPESSRQAELGAKITFLGGKGFAGLSIYDLRRENIAIPDSTGFQRQLGNQRSRGIELDLSAQPAPGWSTHATFAFTDAILTEFSELVPLAPPEFVVVDRSGNRAAFAPKQLLGLWVSRSIGRLGVALGLRHVGEQFVSEDNRHAISPWTTLDAALSYDLGRARLRVHLKNLTDTEYATRGFGAASAIPARPFELLCRVELGFGRDHR